MNTPYFLIFNFYFHNNLKALLEVDSDNLTASHYKVLLCNTGAKFAEAFTIVLEPSSSSFVTG